MKSFELAHGCPQSLASVFVCCVVFKGELIVNYESKAFEAVYCLHGSVIIDGWWGCGEPKNIHFVLLTLSLRCFCCTPLSEVGDCVAVFLD